MPVQAPPDRRQNRRHPVSAFAHVQHGEHHCTLSVRDLSLQGACLELEQPLAAQEGDDLTLTIELEEVRSPHLRELLEQQPRKILRLKGTLVYRNVDCAGIEYRPVSEIDQVLLTLLLAGPD